MERGPVSKLVKHPDILEGGATFDRQPFAARKRRMSDPGQEMQRQIQAVPLGP